ncbi:MAG: amino acid permease [Bacteroidota bacterium]
MLKQLFRKKDLNQLLQNKEKSDLESNSLAKHLGVKDLTALGIAAIIGAGIFSTIGNASANGGPAVILLFIFTAVACGFSALAYAEFASRIPVSGSAYTYSYVAFGELAAWIIGWSLIMEYAIGNIAVAISWSDYFTALLRNIHISSLGINGIRLPEWMTMDYFTAFKTYKEFGADYANGMELTFMQQEACLAWLNAPSIGEQKIIADLPALLIIFLVTWLVYRGIKESKNISNAMVIIKLCIVFLIIVVGGFYVDTKNWSPFAPNGVSGVLKGISAVFFAYIGFDALSTTAEECKNPQRDLPKGMIYSILICTVLYVLIALVLTGMVPYYKLGVGDPLSFAFEELNLNWLSGIISISAVVAMASVLLVFQLGQPRIWMSMSRDGLLPKKFSNIHPKYKTPGFATIVTGFVVAIPALFLNLTAVTDLCSIGTLFAFLLVCGGVLILEKKKDIPQPKFKITYINSKYIFPALFILSIVLSFTLKPEETKDFFKGRKIKEAENLLKQTSSAKKADWLMLAQSNHGLDAKLFEEENPLQFWLEKKDYQEYKSTLVEFGLLEDEMFEGGWETFKHRIPFWVFLIFCLVMAVLAFKHDLSLIPLAGLISCLYMMSELGISNWIGFSAWLVGGLVIYFSYGFFNSKLSNGVQ